MRSTVRWCCEESTSTGCCTQRWARRLTPCHQWAPIYFTSWVTLYLEISPRAQFYRPLKQSGHTFPLCLSLKWKLEEVSGTWSHPFRPSRQMHRDILICFQPFVFRALLAFPSGSWRLWPKVSFVNTLCFPQLTLPRNDIYSSRWGLSSCPNCVLSCAYSMTLENTDSEK